MSKLSEEDRNSLINYIKANSDSKKIKFEDLSDESLEQFAECLSAINTAKRNLEMMESIANTITKRILK